MAWTSLTYSFLSLLTSSKMTQNQDNFTALAQGLSGAPAILKAAIPASVAYEDEANTFTSDQTIAKSTALLTINDTSGSSEGRLKLARSGAGRTLRDNGTEFQIVNAAFSATIVGIDDTGKFTAGIFPLARMASATVINESGATVAANTVSESVLGSGNDFYIAMHRRTGGNALFESGAVLDTADAIIAEACYALIYTNTSSEKRAQIRNNSNSNTLTYNRKVYRLQES